MSERDLPAAAKLQADLSNFANVFFVFSQQYLANLHFGKYSYSTKQTVRGGKWLQPVCRASEPPYRAACVKKERRLRIELAPTNHLKPIRTRSGSAASARSLSAASGRPCRRCQEAACRE